MSLSIRREVLNFSDAMERILRENDFKGGWKDMDIFEIHTRIQDETRELLHAILSNSPDKNHRISKECVDIANFAMMIFDLEGGL